MCNSETLVNEIQCNLCWVYFNTPNHIMHRINYNTDWVCDSCFKHYCTKCHCCDTIVVKIRSNFGIDGNIYCSNCYHELYNQCSDCNATIELDRNRCDECESNYVDCLECGANLHIDYLEDDVCKCCRTGSLIRPYSYRPETIFHGKGPYYLGVEIEVMPKSREQAAKDIFDIMGDFVYIKNDSSLKIYSPIVEDGIEIVSHPATLDYHKDNWNKLLDKSKEIGIKSYAYDCCGLHVHCSRKNLSKLTIGKIVSFVNSLKNRPFIVDLAQRENPDHANLDEKPVSHILKYKRNKEDRYNSVNLTNRNTIEFRIFKGNLDKIAFFKALEFSEAIQIFCKDSSTRELNYKSFIEFVSKNRKRYDNLHKFCIMHKKKYAHNFETTISTSEFKIEHSSEIEPAIREYINRFDYINYQWPSD